MWKHLKNGDGNRGHKGRPNPLQRSIGQNVLEVNLGQRLQDVMHLYYGGIHVNSTIYFERQPGFRNNLTLAYIVSSNATFDFINRLPEIKGPGYVTVCEVNALGDFENCKHAVTGLSAPTIVSFFEDFAFISQSAADTVTTCKVFKGNGTFYNCEDNATEFKIPSSVEVVAI